MDKVKVKVLARTGIIWEGDGTSCSMINTVGPFDILAQHTQFVSPIQEKITVRDGDKITWDYTLETSAFCRVKANIVEIWLGI